MNQENKVGKLLSTDLAEAGVTIAKVGIGAIIAGVGAPPGTDGAVVALVDSVLKPFTGRRYTLFVEGILERLETLESHLHNIATPDNEHFATIFLTAAREAVLTHEREKVEALQNAVINTAIGIDIEEEMQLIHLSVVAQLSVPHIRILKFAARYYQGCADLPVSICPTEVAVHVLGCQMTSSMTEQLRQMEAVAECLTTDLYGKGLLRERPGRPRPMNFGDDLMFPDMRPKRIEAYEITPLGTSLVKYLSEHRNDDGADQEVEADQKQL